MKSGANKICKENKKQMEMVKTIIKDVVKKKNSNTDTVVVNALENAIKYHNSDNDVALPDAASLVEYVTTIIRIHENNGNWCISKKRESAKTIIIADVYHDVYGTELSIGLTDDENQVTVEDLLQQEALMEQDAEQAREEGEKHIPVGEELDDNHNEAFCDVPFMEEFDIWQSDAYSFIMAPSNQVTIKNGMIKMTLEAFENIFKGAYRI